MASSREDRWKDLDVTKEEVDKIGKALKDEKFRKMFVEYAEEISDPKNREIYEKEIAQMEAEKGMDVQFIHPKPGHVLKVKTKSPGSYDFAKTFINICQNEFIDRPSNEKKTQSNGKMGLQWSIPHSFSPAREDLDKKGEKCAVYDVVFHPDTYKLSENPSFLKLLHDTALDGLERQFGLKIDRSSVVEFKQLKFKGRPEATIMRKKKETSTDAENNNNSNKENDPLANFPYPYEKGVTSEELSQRKIEEVEEQNRRRLAREAKHNEKSKDVTKEVEEGVTTPEYTITNQYGIDMADFSQSLTGVPMPTSNTPSAIVISIHLPKLKSASECELDVTERNLSLHSEQPTAYNLSVKLPYSVDDENGSAKFLKAKKQLVVTLPVRKEKVRQEFKEISDLTAQQAQEENTRPLIEDLGPAISESTNQSSNCSSGGHLNGTDETTLSDQGKPQLPLDSNILYKVPAFSYDQDTESVSLVLDVPSINSDDFHLAYHEREVEVVFSTVSRSGFPTHYYLRCTFPSLVASVSQEIAHRDAVLTITKVSCELWESFDSFVDNTTNETQVNRFVTKTDLDEELIELEKREQLEVVTTERVDAKTDAQFEAPEAPLTFKTGNEVAPSSGIQGILKRTVSESSADDQQNCHGDASLSVVTGGCTSPTELPSPRERKKSVSFNDKIEETMFKSKDSVCQMHKALVNRRKKQRQRQNRKEENIERRRRNSSTDNASSGEEGTNKRKGRRRRHSSSTSDDGITSPRFLNNCQDSLLTNHKDGVCTCADEDLLSNGFNPLPPQEAADGQGDSCNQVITASEDKSETKDTTKASGVNDESDLNSDDDNEVESMTEKETDGKEGVTNWSDTSSSDFVDKTKCAFDFNNSVIFDLDE